MNKPPGNNLSRPPIFTFCGLLGGAIAPTSAALLHNKIDELSREFAQLHARDAALPVSERTNFGIVMAMRPWELGAFGALRRESPECALRLAAARAPRPSRQNGGAIASRCAT